MLNVTGCFLYLCLQPKHPTMKTNRITLLGLLVGLFATSLYAQDPRERNYYYEILQPSHAAKPKIDGFAHDRIHETLNRGLQAMKAEDGSSVYLSWRLLTSDDTTVGFHVYRRSNNRSKRLTSSPIRNTTDFMDTKPLANASYYVVPVTGRKQGNASEMIEANLEKMNTNNYRSIPLKEGSRVGKLAVADLNGDGVYDYIVRTPSSNVDPGMPGNTTGLTYTIEAYLSDGTYLWAKDLGQGIEPGVWYSPFVCYDFNGDGKAEVAVKTADERIVRNAKGRVDSGAEYLSILDGMTGKELDRVAWPERNDRYGDLNRQSRNQMGMAFLDGKTPYILTARGTYKLMTVEAWSLNGNKLEKAWSWDGDEENPVVRSQGAHNMICTDVDGDGRDEIVLGSCTLDDDGTLLWSVGLGHPDKIYISDIDPNRPGMEMFLVLEPYHTNGRGVAMIDPKDGSPIWNIGHNTYHVGDGMITDFDPEQAGLECFASEDRKGGSTDKYLLSADGRKLGQNEDVPPCRNWVWWDADLLREYVGSAPRTGNEQGARWQSMIGKWKGETLLNPLEGSILMIADLTGDWREEIITSLPGELRIYQTNLPAKDRRACLMQDPLYRNYVAHRSMGYDQAPVPSFYLGE